MSGSQDSTIRQMIEVVALALRDSRDGRWLLARRGPGGGGAGEWEFPGGKVELGESQRSALVREISEELSFDLSRLDLVYVGENVHTYPSKRVRIHLWRAEVSETPVFILSDHDSVGWYRADQLEEIGLSEGDKPFISLLV